MFLLFVDLVVDMNKAYAFNAKAKAWQKTISKSIAVAQDDEKINEVSK